jgi:hypothetical protein
MLQQVVPGGSIEALTPHEAAQLFEAAYRENVEERVRAAATIILDATGSGEDDVYSPPLGFEFEVRRVSVDLSSATDVGTGNVALAAGHTLEYLRGVGGTRIEWAQPQFGAAVQVPGVQTWGAEQGAYIRNGETFAVRAKGLTANASLDITVEGLLRKPATKRGENRQAGHLREAVGGPEQPNRGRPASSRPGPS